MMAPRYTIDFFKNSVLGRGSETHIFLSQVIFRGAFVKQLCERNRGVSMVAVMNKKKNPFQVNMLE